MTGDAIDRCTLLLVAIDTETHGVIDFALGDGLLAHVAMTDRAIDAGANVRRVIKFHVRLGLEAIDTLPGNVLATRFVCGELFDFGLIGGDDLMAGHAEIDARYARVRPLVNTDMAIRALHSIAEMNFVGIRDGLDGLGANVKEFADGAGDRSMSRREHIGVLTRRSRIGTLRGQNSLQNRQPQDNDSDRNRYTKIIAQAKTGHSRSTF
jgi:hypothetical protein